MVVTDLNSGRVKQKLRTRNALVSAAAAFVRTGRVFSVADVADVAGVGRTTAYRYFPNQELLLAQAALSVVAETDDRSIYTVFDRSQDPFVRLDAVIAASHASTAAHDGEYRAMLRASLDPSADSVPHRLEIRRKWLADALAPVRKALGSRRYARLVAALSVFVGVEASVVLRDVAMLKPDAAGEVKRWAARAILRAALDDVEAGRSASWNETT
jgi:AcrR family transcriptional regulator